jgi:hypothetical protein
LDCIYGYGYGENKLKGGGGQDYRKGSEPQGRQTQRITHSLFYKYINITQIDKIERQNEFLCIAYHLFLAYIYTYQEKYNVLALFYTFYIKTLWNNLHGRTLVICYVGLITLWIYCTNNQNL